MSQNTKSVHQIIEMARNHIKENFATDPGFKGAYLIGSINHMAPGDPFPDYRDVDIGVITDNVSDRSNTEQDVNGYIIEVVCGNPSLSAAPIKSSPTASMPTTLPPTVSFSTPTDSLMTFTRK